MKLLEFSCKLIGNSVTNVWRLDKLNFNPHINLLVGQNATGKSRVVRFLNTFVNLITDNDVFEDALENYSKSEWHCLFQKENGDTLSYNVSFDFKKHIKVQEEKLSLNGEVLLNRKNGDTEIFSFLANKFLKISPPNNKFVLHVRRDTEEFPFFEDVAKWAEQFEMYKFADAEAGKHPSFWFDDLDEQSVEELKKDFNRLGYEVNNIFIKKDKLFNTSVLHILEEGVEKSIAESELSQGMSRALELLTFVQYLLQMNETSILLIDDLCEGLDYERATKLGKLIVEKIENSNIQLVATSNERFLMNVVDTKYWNILMRDGISVKSFNYKNSKEIFDEFRIAGLSNFYLFSSDFLLQKI